MADTTPVSTYLSKITQAKSDGNATEHTYRPALKDMVEAIGVLAGQDVIATNEPKQIKRIGAPDMLVAEKTLGIGYIEAKDVGKSLDQVEKTDQFARYVAGLPSLILTNYLEFRWYLESEHAMTVALDPADGSGTEELQTLIAEFLKRPTKSIRSPEDLATRMGGKAQLMRNVFAQALQSEDKGGELHNQLKAFRKVLIQDLSEAQFADMYAQTICYGMFAARCNHRGTDPFDRYKAAHDLPKTNPFLREIFGHIAGPELDGRVTWIVDDLAEILDRADIDRILKDFGKRTKQEDPVVHFYETFLTKYDPKLREARGVYYTPEPVVSYIVRSVDAILKKDFGIKDGLADATKVKLDQTISGGHKEAHRVTILDPAAGTGTFLHGVIDHIYGQLKANNQLGTWSAYVQQHLLPRLFGFELLMAPYAVCHMKLGLQLQELGYDFKANERLRVYLTNTLEEAHEASNLPLFTQHLAREAYEAGEAKQDHPVMVVLGNPPYSGHSANKGKWIHDLLRGKDTLNGEKTENYFEFDGKPLGERNPKWLNDDYVKFIRFAQWRIERTGYGILAFISNHGYLDNPTFRGMRESLMATFDDIYVLDLHGNTKKKEKAPDGTADKNVFDIQQGVAIGIFVKKKGNAAKKKPAQVHHADLWGTRNGLAWIGDEPIGMGGKYGWLDAHSTHTTNYTKLNTSTNFRVFRKQDQRKGSEYEALLPLTTLFPVNVLGFQTHRDAFSIAFNEVIIENRLKDMESIHLDDQQLSNIYKLRDNRDWQVGKAREKLRAKPNQLEPITQCAYRPFDNRWCYFDEIAMDYPRRELLDNVFDKSNLCLLSSRQQGTIGYRHAWVSQFPANDCVVSTRSREANQVFPLYLYPSEEKADLFDTGHEATDAPGGRRPNLSEEFIASLTDKLGLAWVADGQGDLKKTVGPEDVFHYIYAVLHAPTYRERYAEFLAIDFPRVPLTTHKALFKTLCGLGRELTALHLMTEFGALQTGYPADGSHQVEKVRYTPPDGNQPGRVWINDTQHFAGVPEEVWAFHVGGYQVCDKWLKDRKGRELSYEDISHYQGIVANLARTIELMAAIDAAIDKAGGWPLK